MYKYFIVILRLQLLNVDAGTASADQGLADTVQEAALESGPNSEAAVIIPLLLSIDSREVSQAGLSTGRIRSQPNSNNIRPDERGMSSRCATFILGRLSFTLRNNS